MSKLQERLEKIPLKTRLFIGLQMNDYDNWKDGEYLGDNDTNLLRTFYNIASSSQYTILWKREGLIPYFEILFPKLCTESMVTVGSNGEMAINFGNIRGSEAADLFREILYDELNQKIELDIPLESKNNTYRIYSTTWINKADKFMNILGYLLEEIEGIIEVE